MTQINYIIIFTTRKRSLGQGYVFTRVCHSVYKRGVSVRETPPPDRDPPPYGEDRAVRILLECFLVCTISLLSLYRMWMWGELPIGVI